MFVLPLKVGVVMVVAMEIRVGVAVEMEMGVIVSLGRGDRVVGERECRCVWCVRHSALSEVRGRGNGR